MPINADYANARVGCVLIKFCTLKSRQNPHFNQNVSIMSTRYQITVLVSTSPAIKDISIEYLNKIP